MRLNMHYATNVHVTVLQNRYALSLLICIVQLHLHNMCIMHYDVTGSLAPGAELSFSYHQIVSASVQRLFGSQLG